MQTFQAILILLIFIASVALMMTRKLPTILALPLMAIAIAAVAGVPFYDPDAEFTIVQNVLESGAMRMASGMTGLFFGAWFGKVLTKVGVTHTIIRKAAELAGDKPMATAFVFLTVCSVLFAAASGLGMVILVGTIIIPIMISTGLSPMVSGLVVLLANGIGVTFHLGTLAVYGDALGLSMDVVTSYSWVSGLPIILVSIIMLYVFIKKDKKKAKAWAMPSGAEQASQQNVRAIAMISPLIPVVLVFVFNLPITAATMIGIVCTLILATPKKCIQVVSGAFIEGLQDASGALALLIGIGMTLQTVTAPQVSAILSPVISALIPSSPIMYVLVFGVLSPLAIYRGPLNMYGLGSGIAALLVASGMNPIAAMLALRMDSNLQAVCDPTNSHNVWVSDFTKTDVNVYTTKTILWLAVSTFAGLALAAFLVF